MKKVLFFTEIPSPFQYEFTNAISNLLEGKAELKVVFEKANKSFRTHWNTPNFGVVLDKQKKGKHFKSLLNEIDPDILVFTQYNSRYTFQGIRWANKNSKPYFLGPHEIIKPNDTYYLTRYAKHRYYKFMARNSKGVATMGNQAVRDISKIYKGPVVNIPYSFDLTRLLSMTPPPISNNNEIIFLYSGRLYDFRNPILCIKAFAKVKVANPTKKLKLIISGTGPLEQECLDLIDQLKIKDNVTWMNDFKDWYEIHTLYSHAHVLLALQYYGTWGIIIQEAMAAGLGIISTNTIQAADNLIIDDYNGYLVTLNERQIIERMEKYINDPSLINKHGKRSKEIVKNLDSSNAGLKFLELIEAEL